MSLKNKLTNLSDKLIEARKNSRHRLNKSIAVILTGGFFVLVLSIVLKLVSVTKDQGEESKENYNNKTVLISEQNVYYTIKNNKSQEYAAKFANTFDMSLINEGTEDTSGKDADISCSETGKEVDLQDGKVKYAKQFKDNVNDSKQPNGMSIEAEIESYNKAVWEYNAEVDRYEALISSIYKREELDRDMFFPDFEYI